MIKNNKGFMLIEVIITSTIVVTAMIVLYASFNKLYNNYRQKNSYYNLDAVYATKEMINSMIKNKNINTFIYYTIPKATYGYIVGSNGECYIDSVSNSVSNCQILKNLYNINNMIFSEYDKQSLVDLKNNETQLSQTFREYIDYVIMYYDIGITGEVYDYIVLTEIEDGDNNYYANLRIR